MVLFLYKHKRIGRFLTYKIFRTNFYSLKIIVLTFTVKSDTKKFRLKVLLWTIR